MSVKASTTSSRKFTAERVFARVRGWPMWPARVEARLTDDDPKKVARVRVFFYGTYESAVVTERDLLPYNEETRAKLGLNATHRRKGFKEALEEVENNPDVMMPQMTGAVVTDTAEEEHEEPPALLVKRRNTSKDHKDQPPAKVVISEPPTPAVQTKWELTSPALGVHHRLYIDCEQERPATMSSDEAKRAYYAESKRKVGTLNKRLQEGSALPKEVLVQLDALKKRGQLPDVGVRLLTAMREQDSRAAKLRWLKIEQDLSAMNQKLMATIHYQKPNMEQCVKLLDHLLTLPIALLMLLKHPELVNTIKKLRRYVGPETLSDPRSVDANTSKLNQLAKDIRLRANAFTLGHISNALGLQHVPFAERAEVAFNKFDQKLDAFKIATDHMAIEDIAVMVVNPLS